jgi:cell division protein FtsB
VRPALLRVLFAVLAAAVVAAGLYFVAASPVRAWLDQRRERTALERRVALLAEENGRLAARARELHTDRAIEQLAREQYNLVRPGEEPYAILPAPRRAGEAGPGRS